MANPLTLWHKFTRNQQGDMGIYVLTSIFIFMLILLSLAFMAIHSVDIAQGTMSEYIHDALQQTNEQLAAVAPTDGSPGVSSSTATQVFTHNLQSVLAQTAWANDQYTIQEVKIYTEADAGNPGPGGNGTIPGAGAYADITMPWTIPFPGSPKVTLNIAGWMSANVYIQPTKGWNGG